MLIVSVIYQAKKIQCLFSRLRFQKCALKVWGHGYDEYQHGGYARCRESLATRVIHCKALASSGDILMPSGARQNMLMAYQRTSADGGLITS